MSESNEGPPGMQKEVIHCSLNRLTLAASLLRRGGQRHWGRCLGGEEDSPPCLLTTVNPSASVIELYNGRASVATDVTNPSMVKIRHASFSSNCAPLKSISSEKTVPPAARMPAIAANMKETFVLLRRANFNLNSLPGPAEEQRREREFVWCFFYGIRHPGGRGGKGK